MSILKSTKSGKSGTEITLHYLLEKGWYQPYEINNFANSFSKKVKIDSSKICIGPKVENNPHFLYISHDKNGVTEFTFRIKVVEKTRNQFGVKPEYIYEFPVKSLSDLDLVISFWNESKINRKRKLRDLIISKSKKESNTWYSFPDSLKNEFQSYVQSDIDNLNLIKQKVI